MRKARLTTIAGELAEKPVEAKTKAIEANPERGRRGGFFKITVTISPELYEAITLLRTKRRARGMKDTDFSALNRNTQDWYSRICGSEIQDTVEPAIVAAHSRASLRQ
jgi:hypothetical protein